MPSVWAHNPLSPHSHLVFGVFNQQSLARTAHRWGPLLAHIGQTTGHDLRLRMGPSNEDTNAMLQRGDFDFVFTNQSFRREYDGTYKVVAQLAGPAMHGLLVVNASSQARQLTDLNNKKVAFTSREAFETCAVPMLALRKAGVNVLPTYSGTQDAALVALKSGQVDAAAVHSRLLAPFAAQHALEHRVIFKSDPYPDVPVLAHPSVSQATVKAVCNALIGMSNQTQGLDALLAADLPGFVASSDARYASVRNAYRNL